MLPHQRVVRLHIALAGAQDLPEVVETAERVVRLLLDQAVRGDTLIKRIFCIEFSGSRAVLTREQAAQTYRYELFSDPFRRMVKRDSVKDTMMFVAQKKKYVALLVGFNYGPAEASALLKEARREEMADSLSYMRQIVFRFING
ncbi:unnamed protein product, partial [Mesorhabditis spiculigera]